MGSRYADGLAEPAPVEPRPEFYLPGWMPGYGVVDFVHQLVRPGASQYDARMGERGIKVMLQKMDEEWEKRREGLLEDFQIAEGPLHDIFCAIFIYTYEDWDEEAGKNQLYYIMNKAMREGILGDIERYRPLIYHVDAALKQLPTCSKACVPWDQGCA